MSADYVIQARRGDASPPAVGLVAGQVVGPLAFGQTASWPVAARGVLPQHGFFYFDGTTLFVRSVDAMLPVRVGDHAVPEDWIPVKAPSRILFGGAELTFEHVPRAEGQLGDLSAPPEPSVDETGRYPLPKRAERGGGGAGAGLANAERKPGAAASVQGPTSARSPAAAPSPNAGSRSSAAPRAGVPDLSPKRGRGPIDDEVTRLGSVDDIVLRARAAKAAVEASSPSLQAPTEGAAGRSAPLFGPPPSRTPDAPAAKPAEPRPVTSAPTNPAEGPRPSPAPSSGMAARWAAASLPNKASIVLMPLMAASLWIIFFYDDTGARPRPKAFASASAAPLSSAPPTRSGASGPSDTSSGPTEVVPAPSGSGPRPKIAPAKERTLERRAADAVAAGDYAGAATLYDELVREQPDRAAFKEAARILRAKSTTRK